MNTLFVWGVVVGAVIVGGFFALNAYLYDEKQGDGTQPEIVASDDRVVSDNQNSIDSTEQSKPAKPEIPTAVSGKTLDLSSKGLTKVPESTFKQTDIVVLDLSDNKLTGALQAEIHFMVNLKSLDLSDNNFTGVPAEVGQLGKLEYLDLSNNPLTGLPYELGNLQSLKVLDLRGTNYAKQDLGIIRAELSDSVLIRTE